MDINNVVLDKTEIRRYSGDREKFKIIPELEEKIDSLIEEVKSKARVKYVYEIFDIKLEDEKINFANVSFISKQLAKNLNGCHKVILLAITLGNEVDLLIRRYSSLDSTSMVFLQAIAAEYLEKCIDEIEKEVVENSDEKLYVKPRFSPGYGDLNISYQKDFVTLLNTPKKIGLSLTNAGMLTPTKSVTAIIGLTKEDFRNKNADNKCNSCNANCSFREIKET